MRQRVSKIYLMQEVPSLLTRKVAKITFQTAILDDKSKLFDGADQIKRRLLFDVFGRIRPYISVECSNNVLLLLGKEGTENLRRTDDDQVDDNEDTRTGKAENFEL